MRRIIQIGMGVDGEGYMTVVALAEDGTLWNGYYKVDRSVPVAKSGSYHQVWTWHPLPLLPEGV